MVVFRKDIFELERLLVVQKNIILYTRYRFANLFLKLCFQVSRGVGG
jgi:hypothetical protein